MAYIENLNTIQLQMSNHLVLFFLFSCLSQKKRLYLQYKKYRRICNEYRCTMTDTYSLEIPRADTSLLKSLVKRMGWTVHKTTTKHTAYEQALNDKEQGRVNEYASADELFSKLGI